MLYLRFDVCLLFFFFFQAEDGIRDGRVTGVQTCALPISTEPLPRQFGHGCCSANSPCEVATTPVPSHWGHRFGAVPGAAPVPWHVWHASSSVTGTVVCSPLSESSNETRTSTSTSAPRWPRCWPRPFRPGLVRPPNNP